MKKLVLLIAGAAMINLHGAELVSGSYNLELTMNGQVIPCPGELKVSNRKLEFAGKLFDKQEFNLSGILLVNEIKLWGTRVDENTAFGIESWHLTGLYRNAKTARGEFTAHSDHEIGAKGSWKLIHTPELEGKSDKFGSHLVSRIRQKAEFQQMKLDTKQYTDGFDGAAWQYILETNHDSVYRAEVALAKDKTRSRYTVVRYTASKDARELAPLDRACGMARQIFPEYDQMILQAGFELMKKMKGKTELGEVAKKPEPIVVRHEKENGVNVEVRLYPKYKIKGKGNDRLTVAVEVENRSIPW